MLKFTRGKHPVQRARARTHAGIAHWRCFWRGSIRASCSDNCRKLGLNPRQTTSIFSRMIRLVVDGRLPAKVWDLTRDELPHDSRQKVVNKIGACWISVGPL